MGEGVNDDGCTRLERAKNRTDYSTPYGEEQEKGPYALPEAVPTDSTAPREER